MIVQWCLKGLDLPAESEARTILDSGAGLLSNWARDRSLYWHEMPSRLTASEIDRHVNHFSDVDPGSGDPYSRTSPFISLTAGTVERLPGLATNRVRSALDTALWFGSGFGAALTAYVFYCWVIVGPRPTPGIYGVAEEVRELNQYRRYSAFQTEGEILAKVSVPDNQVLGYEVWQRDPATRRWDRSSRVANPRFVPPESLTNVRDLLR